MNNLRIGLSFTPEVLTDPAHAPALESLDLIVFPELVDGGYAALRRGEGKHRRGDSLWATLRESSASFGSVVVGGSMVLAEARSGRFFNASPVFAKGRLLHLYEKIHLFTPAGDDQFFERGRRIGMFSFTAGASRVKTGLVLCYDLRFPELIRAMALRGMQLLVVPARWPVSRDHAWKTLLQARAIENQVFVVGCNAPDAEGGHSYVIDPLGRVVFSSAESPGSHLYSVTVDLGGIAEAQSLHRNLRDAVVLRNSFLPRILPDPRGRIRRRARGRSGGR